ncbi:MAG: outer membrane protein assembly factor BamD [Deltaproteobacteria bacterium]|nr:MAG: outer membrane protein assembly factor BamD [Deltaproteobacteria bacterium]
MRKRCSQWLVVCLFLMLSSGCGMLDSFLLAPPEDTAQELAELGNEAMQEKDYGDAIEAFQKLRDRYPFSPFTTAAELSLADAYFLDEQYLAASESYKEFESLHPRHESIAYVLLQIGVSDYNQFESLDLPQDNIVEALEYFRRVRSAYPETEYAAKADTYILKCKRYIAEHEILVADFYWRSERYQSAWMRYDYVIRHFSDLPEIVAYAQAMASQSYVRYQETLSTRAWEKEQKSWKQWFDWL